MFFCFTDVRKDQIDQVDRRSIVDSENRLSWPVLSSWLINLTDNMRYYVVASSREIHVWPPVVVLVLLQ